MKRIVLAAAGCLFICGSAFAGQPTIADRCIAHVSKGAITAFRDVDVLGSGRERIAYFRCIRSGLRDDSGASAFAGLVPSISPLIGGSGTGFGSFNINL